MKTPAQTLFSWDNIRRAVGVLLLIYLVVVNPPGIPSWVGVLVGGMIGLFDVTQLQETINRRRNGNGKSDSQDSEK